MMGIIYLVGTIVFTVYGQLIIKSKIVYFGELPSGSIEKISFLFSVLLNPWIFSGFVSAFVASFFWMAAMTKFEVSFAYPIIVGGLAVTTSVLAILLLNESVNFTKMAGLILIVTGVFILGRTS